LQGNAEKALAEAEALKLQARLEDLTVWYRAVLRLLKA